MPAPRKLAAPLCLAFALACTDADIEPAPGSDTNAIAPADTTVPPELANRAREAANTLGAGLQTRLLAALETGGPELAVSVCADSAQRWTAELAAEGTYARRVTLRVRNPENRPDSTEERLLHEFADMHSSGSLPQEIVRWVTDGAGERALQYARPILVAQPCLACHGERAALAPEVQALLADRYPNDSAVGYSAGDLRGMISVRVRR